MNDQSDRLAIFAIGGATEGPDAWLAQRRLEYARDLAEHGRIGEDKAEDDDDAS